MLAQGKLIKITFIAYGTRGDVQPALALASALHARGHTVRILASANFAPWIEGQGLQAAPASVDIQAMMMSEGGNEWIEHGTHPIKQARVMKKLIDQYGLAMMQDAWQACQDAEMVVSSFTSDTYAVSIAEKLGARHVSIPMQPALVATRSGAATPNAPLPERESWLNYLFGRLIIEPFAWRLVGQLHNRFRQERLGLPAQNQAQNRQALRRMLVLLGYSPQVVPHPRDWPANIHTTGYWFLDEEKDWPPPPALQAFLAEGEAPVYVGFGSMTGRDPQALTRLILAAGAQASRRLVIQTGWASLGSEALPKDVFLLDSAPHHWLFPRMRAVVHHGGAGTTAESLRAGKPTVIIPHLADQPFWGRRIAALGAGPPPIPRNRLTVDNLARAISQAASDEGMHRRAGDLGQAIRAEDGIGTAIKFIENHSLRS